MALLQAPLALPQPDRERIRLLTRLGRACVVTGQGDAGHAHQEEALRLASACGDRALEAEVRYQYCSLSRIPTDQRVGMVETALALYRELGDRDGEALALYGLGTLAMGDRPLEVRDLFLASLQLHRALGNRQMEGRVLNGLGIVECYLGRPAEALAHLDDAMAAARDTAHPTGLAHALANQAIVYRTMERLDDGIRCAEAALAQVRSLGERRSEGIALSNLASLRRANGQHAEALAAHHEALPINEELGYAEGVAMDHLGLGRVHRELGSPERALHHLGEAVRRAELSKTRVEAHLHLGMARRDAGDLAEAEAAFRISLDIAQHCEPPHLEGAILGEWALVYRDAGRFEEARSLLLQSEQRLRGTNPTDDLWLGCLRVQIESAAGEVPDEAMAEVERLRAALGNLDFEVQRALDEARQACRTASRRS